MGGKKRKIPMKKLETKEQRAVMFSKRRNGLFKKASDLCLLYGTHIAILATPPSKNSNVSFYSFGHSSVDNVIDAFLENRAPAQTAGNNSSPIISANGNNRCCFPCKKEGLGFWWEDEGFEKFESAEDLKVVIESTQKLKNNVMRRLNNHTGNTHINMSFSNGDSWFPFDDNQDFENQEFKNYELGGELLMLTESKEARENKVSTNVDFSTNPEGALVVTNCDQQYGFDHNQDFGNYKDFPHGCAIKECENSGMMVVRPDLLLEHDKSELGVKISGFSDPIVNDEFKVESNVLDMDKAQNTKGSENSEFLMNHSEDSMVVLQHNNSELGAIVSGFADPTTRNEFDFQIDNFLDEPHTNEAQNSEDDYQTVFQEFASCLL